MASYELIVEKQQPDCGGKDPRVLEFQSVETADPVEYVRGLHPGMELDVEQKSSGELVVAVGEGVKRIRYCFTED